MYAHMCTLTHLVFNCQFYQPRITWEDSCNWETCWIVLPCWHVNRQLSWQCRKIQPTVGSTILWTEDPERYKKGEISLREASTDSCVYSHSVFDYRYDTLRFWLDFPTTMNYSQRLWAKQTFSSFELLFVRVFYHPDRNIAKTVCEYIRACVYRGQSRTPGILYHSLPHCLETRSLIELEAGHFV